MIPKTYQIAALITAAILIFSVFLGYTFYADAQALQQVYAEVETLDKIIPSLNSASIIFTLNITNPSSRNLYGLSSNFNIFIEENFIGTGSFSNYDVPAKTSIIQQVTINVNYKGLAESAIDLLQNWISGQNSVLSITGNMTASVIFVLATVSHEYTATSN